MPPTPTKTLTPTIGPSPTIPLPYESHKEAYYPWFDGDLSAAEFTAFREMYEAARRGKASWLNSSKQIADTFVEASLPLVDGSIPGCSLLEEKTIPAEVETDTYIYVFGNCLDDSVWGIKIRVDVVIPEGVGIVTWGGKMFKCYRGYDRLRTNWHNVLCP